MKETLERLKNVQAPVCVTIIQETHKANPEALQDPIQLKNLIREAGRRLENEHGEKVAKDFTAKLEAVAAQIDHTHNDRGLMLFVSDDTQEYLKLPVPLHDRVIIDTNFATRPIVRTLKRHQDYYALILARGGARLLQASGEELVEEIKNDDFPIKENDYHPLSQDEASIASRVTNLNQEYFNQVDKALNRARDKNPLPVIICSDENNYSRYLQEADHPDTIIGHVLLKDQDERASNLIKYIWPHVESLRVEKHRKRIEELEDEVSRGNVVTDLNEIWRAVQEGRGKTVFVEEGYFQPVRKEEDGTLTPIDQDDIDSKEDIDDIVDEIIEQTLKFGGDVVFAKVGMIEGFGKVVLATRY